jgi:outer membrane protein OmpA-like peptidoglycan-associated protein
MARAVAPSEGGPRKKLYRAGGPGERWWFAVLLVPALLTALAVYSSGPAIESELEKETVAALAAAGLTGTAVEMHGRNVTVRVPTGQSQSKAQQAAEAVTGIGNVDIERVARNAAEARACEGLQAKMDDATRGRGIGFDGSSTSLAGASATAVHTIARLLVRCPSAAVAANGYTDGSVLNGSTVSLRRAEAVRNALLRGGVKPARVDAKGFGDTFPVTDDDSPAGRAANNRVTITLVED